MDSILREMDNLYKKKYIGIFILIPPLIITLITISFLNLLISLDNINLIFPKFPDIISTENVFNIALLGSVIICLFFISFFMLFKEFDHSTLLDNSPSNLENRIEILDSSLKTTLSVISEIETEIEAKSELVNRLEIQKRIVENAINLNKEQVMAVSTLLTEEIRKDNKKGFAFGCIKDLFLLILGAMIAPIISFFISFLTK